MGTKMDCFLHNLIFYVLDFLHFIFLLKDAWLKRSNFIDDYDGLERRVADVAEILCFEDFAQNIVTEWESHKSS